MASRVSAQSLRRFFSASTMDSAITRLRYHLALAGTTVHGACFAAVFEIASS